MLTYKAMYKFLDEGVHAEVLDFPGVISCGGHLEEARWLLASTLVDMAETVREGGDHSIWENPTVHRRASVPRHREIPNFTVRRICTQLCTPHPF